MTQLTLEKLHNPPFWEESEFGVNLEKKVANIEFEISTTPALVDLEE